MCRRRLASRKILSRRPRCERCANQSPSCPGSLGSHNTDQRRFDAARNKQIENWIDEQGILGCEKLDAFKRRGGSGLATRVGPATESKQCVIQQNPVVENNRQIPIASVFRQDAIVLANNDCVAQRPLIHFRSRSVASRCGDSLRSSQGHVTVISEERRRIADRESLLSLWTCGSWPVCFWLRVIVLKGFARLFCD